MAIKKYKPITNGRRNMTGYSFEEITVSSPYKPLVEFIKSRAGRNKSGRMTVRHQGSGVKKLYRKIDFKQDKYNISGVVETIEYDPYRTARIALIKYPDGERRYILVPNKVEIGTKIVSSEKAKAKPGNRMALENIPAGMAIHNIELNLGQGGKLVRSAGVSATMVTVDEKYAQIKLPSGEIRLINKKCHASIGVIGNEDHQNIKIGKAGRKRHMGIRPTVRGKAKNVREHPHGSGEGGCPIGLKYPKTPWGKHALGVKTRNNKRTDKFVLVHRKGK
jgi:large subunit ribosomal protein L2